MRRVYLIVLSAVSMISLSMAQKFEVGFDMGYGIGVGEALKGRNITWDTITATKLEQVYGSGGNGLKLMADFTYFINENFGIMAMTGYSMLGGYSTEYQGPTWTDKQTIKASYIPINIGLKFRAKIGSIMPYVYLSPGLYFPAARGTHTWTGSPDEKTTYSYATGFGFNAGMGAAYRISDKMGIRMEITPTYAFANLTQVTYEQNGIKHTIIYKNNMTHLPESTYETQYMPDQPRDSFSSLAIKAGMFFSF